MADKKEDKEPEEKKEKKTNYLPTEEHDELLAKIKRQVTEHPVVKKFHDKWKELIAWTDEGKQFGEYKTGAWTPVQFRNRKKMVVVNLMKPLSEAIEGKIDMTHELVGLPNSGEVEDSSASQVATKLLSHNDYVNDNTVLDEDIKYDMTRTGNAFKKTVWNKNKHGYIRDEDGKNVEQPGEVVSTVPSVFNMRPDPTAQKIPEDCRWFVELEPVTFDWILDNFDITREEIQEQVSGKSTVSDKHKGMNIDEDLIDKEEDEAVILRYWERKTKKYKEGRFFIVLGDLFLWKGPNKELGEIPFSHYIYKKSGNTPWGTGPMYHVQDLQREYNRTVSIVSEHIEAWKPKIMMPIGSVKKAGAFTTDIAEILEYDDSKTAPHSLTLPQLNPEVMVFLQLMEGGFGKVSNVHEVSYSQLPKYASRAPASLFSMMMEQENMKLDPMIKRINQTIIKEGIFRLRLMDKYYKQERMIKVVGKDVAASVEYFKGADLNGNFDVKLSIGVSLHQSKEVLRRLVIELKQNQVLNDKDNNKILKLLQMGDLSEELRGDLSDTARAIRENHAFINETDDKQFAKGGVKMYIHDDHELHLGYHTNLRKSEEVQAWSDERLARIDAHIDEHLGKVMELRQMAQQMMASQTNANKNPPSVGPGGQANPPPTPGAKTPPAPGTPGM